MWHWQRLLAVNQLAEAGRALGGPAERPRLVRQRQVARLASWLGYYPAWWPETATKRVARSPVCERLILAHGCARMVWGNDG